MALDRLAILAPRELARERVDVPEWGGHVFVRVLTAAERDALELIWESTKRRNLRARLAVSTVCDEHGADIFHVDDVEQLGRQASTALVRIADTALRVNGFTKADVEQLEKNSPSDPSDDSSSDSPRISE